MYLFLKRKNTGIYSFENIAFSIVMIVCYGNEEGNMRNWKSSIPSNLIFSFPPAW